MEVTICLYMQPHSPQVPSPDCQMGSGVYLLANIDAGVYQFVLSVIDVGNIGNRHYIQPFSANLEILYRFHA